VVAQHDEERLQLRPPNFSSPAMMRAIVFGDSGRLRLKMLWPFERPVDDLARRAPLLRLAEQRPAAGLAVRRRSATDRPSVRAAR
jgi:hypothetical protein